MTSTNAKKLISALLAAACVFALSACGSGSAAVSQPEESYIPGQIAGEELTAASAGDSVFSLNCDAGAGFDPYTTKNADNQLVDQLVYENIFDVDDDFNLSSRIVTSWESADGAYWYFNVDTSIVMHDGTNLTAKDVAYSLQRAMNSSRYTGRFSYVWGASATDEDTFAVSLSAPNRQFPYLLTVPVVKYDSKGEDTPVGTGPYVFSEDKTKLEAFDGYPNWQDLPVDSVGLVEYDSVEATITAYEDSFIDLVVNDPNSSSNLGYGGNNEQRYFTTNCMHYLGVNMKSDYLRDTAFRYALQFALDREYAVKTLMHGAAASSSLPISPNSPLFDAGLNSTYKYDIDRCERVLAAAGVEDYDSDGKKEYMVTGIPMEIDLRLIVCSDGGAKTDVAWKLKEDLGAIGVTVTVEELGWDEYLTALDKGEFDLYYGEIRLTADFSLTRLLTEDGDLNYCSITDPAYGELISQYLAADDTQRASACKLMLQYIAESAPIIPICFERREVITHRNVATGLNPGQYNVFLGFPQWTISFKSDDGGE